MDIFLIQVMPDILGGFFGALFAFIFFIFGVRWQKKFELFLIIKKEHTHLERYFNDLSRSVSENKFLLNSILETFQEKSLPLISLRRLPIREDITMRLADIAYINDVYKFMLKVDTINGDLESSNNWRNKICDSIEKYLLDQKREEFKTIIENSVKSFSEESRALSGGLDMLLSVLKDLMATNSYFLDYYKLNFLKRWYIRFCNKLSKKYKNKQNQKKVRIIQEARQRIESEFQATFDQDEEELKKFGIIK